MTDVDPKPTRIIELRIHGVSGTPPKSMLQWDIDQVLKPTDVEQIAGDELTGFYRRRVTVRPDDPAPTTAARFWFLRVSRPARSGRVLLYLGRKALSDNGVRRG